VVPAIRGFALSTVQSAIARGARKGPERERGLEDAAFERLRALDVDGSRTAFESFANRVLDSVRLGERPERAGILLLHDTVQEVHRRLERPDPGAGNGPALERYREGRDRLIETFAAIDGLEPAHEAFLDAVDSMFRPWRGRRKDAHPIVRRARVFIRENYHERVSLSSVARHLNVSSNYLSRQFRRETGMTLTSFIQRVRLERARELLADKSRTISEIAYLVGYQNYRDFYRNFVKYENASPSQVQRRLSRADAGA
jgi:AraC-like DNA-binding protein